MRDIAKLLERSGVARATAERNCFQSRLTRSESASAVGRTEQIGWRLPVHHRADRVVEYTWIDVLQRCTRPQR